MFRPRWNAVVKYSGEAKPLRRRCFRWSGRWEPAASWLVDLHPQDLRRRRAIEIAIEPLFERGARYSDLLGHVSDVDPPARELPDKPHGLRDVGVGNGDHVGRLTDDDVARRDGNIGALSFRPSVDRASERLLADSAGIDVHARERRTDGLADRPSRCRSRGSRSLRGRGYQFAAYVQQPHRMQIAGREDADGASKRREPADQTGRSRFAPAAPSPETGG